MTSRKDSLHFEAGRPERCRRFPRLYPAQKFDVVKMLRGGCVCGVSASAPAIRPIMVFEESTFVLSKPPAKAAAEVAEPVVQDPSKKRDICKPSVPSLGVTSPKPGEHMSERPKPCPTYCSRE